MRVETMHSVVLRRSVRLLAVAAMAAIPSVAGAQTFTWAAAVDANFSVGASWSGGVAPAGSATTALVFGGAAAYTATNDLVTQPFVLNSLTNTSSGATTVTGGTLSFSGTTPRIVQNGAGALNISSTVRLGANTTVTGTGTAPVNISGPLETGTGATAFSLVVDSNTVPVNLSGGGTVNGFVMNRGTLNLTGGSYTLLNAGGGIPVGPAATLPAPALNLALSIGTTAGQTTAMTISGGAQVTTVGNGMIANQYGATSTFTLTGPGSSLTINDAVGGRFGTYGGNGTINVFDGAAADIRLFEVGRVGGGSSTVSIAGTGSTVTTTQTVLGRGGSNVSQGSTQLLTVSDGGVFNSGLTFAGGPFTTATVNINAGGTLNSGQFQTATGLNSIANVTVANGGVINTGIDGTFLGSGSNSQTTLNIVPGGSYTGEFFYAGANDDAKVKINLDGTATFFDQLVLAFDPKSQVELTVTSTGTLTTDTTALAAGPNTRGTILVDGGTYIENGLNFDAVLGSSFTTLNPAGSTSTFTATNNANVSFGSGVRVGYQTTSTTNAFSASMVINNGATVNVFDNFWVGSAQNAVGVVTVGPGGTLNVDTLAIGFGLNGNGTLVVDGGTLSTTNIGFGANALGSFYTGFTADGGQGALTVKNGGVVNMAGSFQVGRNSGDGTVNFTGTSTGILSVDGPGSQFNNLDSLFVGTSDNSVGIVSVTNSGALNIGTFIAIGSGVNAQGTMIVDNATVTGTEIDLGTDVNATATFTANNGASINIAGDLFTTTEAGSSASMTISGASTSVAFTGNIVMGFPSAGTSAGTGTVTLNSGSLSTGATSFIGLSDQIATSGLSTLAINGGTFTTPALVVAANGTNEASAGLVAVTGGTVNITDGIDNTGFISLGNAGTVSVTGGTVTVGFLQSATNTSVGKLIVGGTGALTVNFNDFSTNAVTSTINASLEGTGGTFTVDSPLLFQRVIGESSTYSGAVVVTGGAALGMAGSVLGGGKILDGASLTVSNGGQFLALTNNTLGDNPRVPANVVVLSSLSIDATSVVDLVDNDMIIRSGTTTLADVRSFIFDTDLVTAFDTYVTPDGTVGFTGLAAISNHDTGGNKVFDSYDGVALGLDDTIVKFTYVGDTNLDGVLTGADVANVLEGYSAGLTGWQNGDLDYDGDVDLTDVTFFFEVYNFVSGLGVAAPSFGNGQGGGTGGGSIPEPSALGLMVPAVAMLTRRRRQA